MTQKQKVGDLNSCFAQSDVGSVAEQLRISVPIADAEADGAASIAPNTAERAMPSSCVVPAKIPALHQDRFSQQRQTNRPQEHKREHDPSAVSVDQLLHDGPAIRG